MHDVPNPAGLLDWLANLESPDLVVCNSEFVRKSGRWLFPRVPRTVIRNPVLFERVQDPSSRREVRSSLQTEPEAIVILQASRMQKWKGQMLLVEALSTLPRSRPWTCWIAGGAQRESEKAFERDVRAAVARLGLADHVRFLGQRSDVPALMDAADIFCQPNVGPEPFGNVLIEALASGLPVVTTAMGGPLEIIDSGCGVLVPATVPEVARALRLLIESDEKRLALSRGGPARARELCDAEARTLEFAHAMIQLGTRAKGLPS